LTQDGERKLVENTLKAQDITQQWREVALVLSEALAMLDFHDVEGVIPYSCIEEINAAVQNNDLIKLCSILNIG
jgi:hypothetical protein